MNGIKKPHRLEAGHPLSPYHFVWLWSLLVASFQGQCKKVSFVALGLDKEEKEYMLIRLV